MFREYDLTKYLILCLTCLTLNDDGSPLGRCCSLRRKHSWMMSNGTRARNKYNKRKEGRPVSLMNSSTQIPWSKFSLPQRIALLWGWQLQLNSWSGSSFPFISASKWFTDHFLCSNLTGLQHWHSLSWHLLLGSTRACLAFIILVSRMSPNLFPSFINPIFLILWSTNGLYLDVGLHLKLDKLLLALDGREGVLVWLSYDIVLIGDEGTVPFFCSVSSASSSSSSLLSTSSSSSSLSSSDNEK